MKYREMAWLDSPQAERKILHLRSDSGQWLPYTSFPTLCKPDSTLPGASKGYPTMQYLLKAGYKLLNSVEASKRQVLELTV